MNRETYSFADLWSRYLSCELDEQEFGELELRLTEDDQLLEAAARAFRTHRLLDLNAEDRERQHESFVASTLSRLPVQDDEFIPEVMQMLAVVSRKRALGKAALWLSMAAAAVLLAVVLFPKPDPHLEIARVTHLHGAVQWTGDSGSIEDLVDVGRDLPGGTLETLDADSWAELRFYDGTMVTAVGRCLLTVSDQDQKILHLRYGNVSADVKRQPSGRPMVIQTPTAELQVLGTQFNIAANADNTMLTVNEGRVRMQQLTDGTVVEVPANHRAIASIQPRIELSAAPRPASVSSWLCDLKTDVLYGTYSSDLQAIAMDLQGLVSSGELTESEAYAKFSRYASGSEDGAVEAVPLQRDLVVILSALPDSHGPVVLTPGARFRIEGYINSATEVEFGIAVYLQDGGFAAKHSTTFTVANDPEMRFELDIPVEEFRFGNSAGSPEYGDSPLGKVLGTCWFKIADDKATLKVTGVELLEQP